MRARLEFCEAGRKRSSGVHLRCRAPKPPRIPQGPHTSRPAPTLMASHHLRLTCASPISMHGAITCDLWNRGMASSMLQPFSPPDPRGLPSSTPLTVQLGYLLAWRSITRAASSSRSTRQGEPDAAAAAIASMRSGVCDCGDLACWRAWGFVRLEPRFLPGEVGRLRAIKALTLDRYRKNNGGDDRVGRGDDVRRSPEATTCFPPRQTN